MKRISFDKGKSFYNPDNNLDADIITSKLNTKTWYALVDKANVEILLENSDKIDKEKQLKANTITDEKLRKKVDRFNILYIYLTYAEEDLII